MAESTIVGFPHDIKGNVICSCCPKRTGESRNHDNLRKEINQIIVEHIEPIVKYDKIQFVPGLPKTRSGKIMCCILRKTAVNKTADLGGIFTLLNPEIVEKVIAGALIKK